jgi:hypothetical protein
MACASTACHPLHMRAHTDPPVCSSQCHTHCHTLLPPLLSLVPCLHLVYLSFWNFQIPTVTTPGYDVMVCQRGNGPYSEEPVWIRAVMIDANFATPSQYNTTLGVLYYREADANKLPVGGPNAPATYEAPAMTPSSVSHRVLASLGVVTTSDSSAAVRFGAIECSAFLFQTEAEADTLPNTTESGIAPMRLDMMHMSGCWCVHGYMNS